MQMGMNTAKVEKFRVSGCQHVVQRHHLLQHAQNLFIQGSIFFHVSTRTCCCMLHFNGEMSFCACLLFLYGLNRSHQVCLLSGCPLLAPKKTTVGRVQVLLRWVLQNGVAAVCEAAGKEIDRANVGVFEWELKSQDFKKLSNIKPS